MQNQHTIPTAVAVDYGTRFRIGRWKETPDDWQPALVLLNQVDPELVHVMLDDGPITEMNNGFLLPTDVSKEHFETVYDSVCPKELQGAFNVIQKHLIDKELPMMSPLPYVRVATMVMNGVTCDQAISMNTSIETKMKKWVSESISAIEKMPRPKT